jgi:chromate transporter
MISDPTSLREIAGLFLRLGATAFGGPAAHIALMRREVVERRGWLSDEAFLDLVGAANLIPGPTSTELAIHIGYERRRWAGLVVAGLAFILPAVAITMVFAFAYVRWGTVPAAASVLRGVTPVILAIVAHAIVGLAPVAARTNTLRFVGLGAGAMVLYGVGELVALFTAGMLGAAARVHASQSSRTLALFSGGALGTSATLGTVAAPTSSSLFFVFAEIGSVLFGSGYVLLAFLRSELVVARGWLTETQLLDAVAVGQITPGPVFTTATFIGYVLSGPEGALAATAGIFLPAFVFVAITAPLLPMLRRSEILGGALDGVNVASLALMVLVTAELARSAVRDVPSALVALASLVGLVRFKIDPTWLLLGGAVIGGARALLFV